MDEFLKAVKAGGRQEAMPPLTIGNKWSKIFDAVLRLSILSS
jgi:hypothetical protein